MAESTPEPNLNAGHPEPFPRTDCVIVDTNELRTSLLLNNTMGAALLYALRQQGGKLGWPEIIEDEIRKHGLLTAREAIKQVGDKLRVLEILVGWRPDPTLPSEQDVESAISQRIADLAPLLVRVPFTIEHAKAALRRVNDETPPNGNKNQQFKDSAIWEAVLEIAANHRVHFVTKDSGFYEGRDLKKGLAKELSYECERAGLEVHVHPELASCVDALRTTAPPLDIPSVIAALDAPLRTELAPEVAKHEFILGELTESFVSAFITERVGILAIKYNITYSGTDTSSERSPRTEVKIRVSGNARFDIDARIASDVQLGHVEFRYTDADGEQRKANIYIAVGAAILGERLTRYKLEHPIHP